MIPLPLILGLTAGVVMLSVFWIVMESSNPPSGEEKPWDKWEREQREKASK